MIVIGGLVVAAAIIAVSSILNGWVLSILWGWFMVPIFSLPALDVAPAIGIALVISYLTRHESCKSNDRSTAQNLGVVFGGPFFALLFGWIVQMFM